MEGVLRISLDADLQLRKPGVAGAGETVARGPVEHAELRFSAAATLQDLAREYSFYTPALLYLTVPLQTDPTADWLLQPESQVPLRLEFQQPIFRGLVRDTQNWNNVLLALPEAAWNSYRDFMHTVAFQGRGRRKLARVRTRDVDIVDPWAMAKTVILPAVWPTVQIHTLWLDTDLGPVYLANRRPLPEPPELLTSQQPFSDTLAMSQALQQHHPDPYKVVDDANRACGQPLHGPPGSTLPISGRELPSGDERKWRDGS